MGKRRRAPMEDGKEKIKKIQAVKAALGADHLAKDKNIKSPNQEKWKPLAMKYMKYLVWKYSWNLLST